MFWNYRIFRHLKPSGNEYALHETYYNEAGQVCAWKHDVDFGKFESPDRLILVLERMLVDARANKEAVLEFDGKPEGDFD